MSQYIENYDFFKLKYISSLIFLVVNLILYILAIGEINFHRLLFTSLVILSVLNFLICLNTKSFFFEKFFTFYMWTGFIFSYFLHIIFFDQNYIFRIGTFDFLNALHLKELYLVLIYFNLGILISIFLSRRFLKLNYKSSKYRLSNVLEKKTHILLFLIFAVIFSIFLTNASFKLFDYYYFSDARYNFVIDSFLKWFFLYGFTSIMCIFLNLQFFKEKFLKFLFCIICIQEFLFYFSILSRGCIFNSLAIFFALVSKKYVRNNYSFKFFTKTLFFIIFLFCINFYLLIDARDHNNLKNFKEYRGLTSLLKNKNLDYEFDSLKNFINYKKIITIRTNLISQKDPQHDEKNVFNELKPKLLSLILVVKNRIFGIDSLMAVVSYEKKGFNLLKLSLKENFEPGKSSFFDEIRLQNNPNELTNNLTLPSIFGFLYYTGSYFFIFISIIFILMFCNLLEKLSIFFNNNVFLSAIIGQLLAYRLWHFGYVPLNSYKLLLSILFTILLCFFLTKIMTKLKIITK